MNPAMKYSLMSSGSRRTEATPSFPRLARDKQSSPGFDRPRVEAPPLPRSVDEEDPERWDGMS